LNLGSRLENNSHNIRILNVSIGSELPHEACSYGKMLQPPILTVTQACGSQITFEYNMTSSLETRSHPCHVEVHLQLQHFISH